MTKAGTITTNVSEQKTTPPKSTAEPFQMACNEMAINKPTSGVMNLTHVSSTAAPGPTRFRS